MIKILFTEEFGKAFIPERIRPELRKYLLKAGFTQEPYAFFGTLFYFVLIIAMAIFLLLILPNFKIADVGIASAFTAYLAYWIAMPLVLAALTMVMIYFVLDVIIYNRTRNIEAVLPEFFDVLSSNLRGGMSFDKALWMSIKPEFGIMANEIAIAAKKVMTGHDIEDALHEFGDKYDSAMLKRSLDLLVSQLQEGGKVVDIIENICMNLKKTRELKEEVTTSVLSYIIFISIIVMFIAPALFGLSKVLFEIIKSVINNIASGMGSNSAMPFTISEIKISSSIFDSFSRISIAIIALFSSMIVSIIEKGNIKGGLKWIPLYLIVSQAVYTLVSLTINKVFGSMFSG